MNKQTINICKFVQNASAEHLITSNFVYESNPDVLNKTTTKKDHTMYLVISGIGKLVTDYAKAELSPGKLFFTFSGIPFKIESEAEFHYIYISFSGERSEVLFKRYFISPENCIFEGNEGLISFWQNAITRATDINLDLISESVLLYTFSQLTPPEISEEQHLLDDILAHIDANFTDFKLNLQTTAENFGYNPKYLSRIFKQTTGTTFSEHLKHTRIKHAIFLMEQGLTSVKNIALLSGYNDPLYFSNVFKKEIGIPASEYIKQNKK